MSQVNVHMQSRIRRDNRICERLLTMCLSAAVIPALSELVSLYPAYPAALLKLDELCRELSGPFSSSAESSSAMVDVDGGAAATSAPVAVAASGRWQPFILVSNATHHCNRAHASA
jgi:hypothetical protein